MPLLDHPTLCTMICSCSFVLFFLVRKRFVSSNSSSSSSIHIHMVHSLIEACPLHAHAKFEQFDNRRTVMRVACKPVAIWRVITILYPNWKIHTQTIGHIMLSWVSAVSCLFLCFCTSFLLKWSNAIMNLPDSVQCLSEVRKRTDLKLKRRRPSY